MRSFFLAFTWRLRHPEKYFNSGATTIVVDASSVAAAKQAAKNRFPKKVLTFTRVSEI